MSETPRSDEQKIVAYFELAVSLHLWRWPALTLAVTNEWGGPDSSDKRDWLAGTIADMFTTAKNAPEIEDIEDVLSQVLSDEFSVVLEDDSAYDLATAISLAFTECQEGRFEKIEQLKVQFQNSKPPPPKKVVDDESDSSSGTDGEVEEQGEAMEVDAPARQEPVIDDDGFELVQGKGKGGGRRR